MMSRLSDWSIEKKKTAVILCIDNQLILALLCKNLKGKTK